MCLLIFILAICDRLVIVRVDGIGNGGWTVIVVFGCSGWSGIRGFCGWIDITIILCAIIFMRFRVSVMLSSLTSNNRLTSINIMI